MHFVCGSCARAITSEDARVVGDAAQKDGARGLGRVAALGGGGKRKATKGLKPHRPSRRTQRDFIRYNRKCAKLPIELYEVEVCVRKRCGLASELKRKQVLLPHEFLGHLHLKHRARFHVLMGSPQDCYTYWWEIMRTKPAWFQEHCYRASIEKNPELWFPCRVFGDDARVGKYRALLAVTLYSAVSKERRTRLKKVPSFVRLSSDLIPGLTDVRLWKALAWSLRCLGLNTYPSVGCFKEPLTGWRKKMAGKPILGEHHAALVSMNGDWMWTADTLQFPWSYKSPGNAICHLCGACLFGDCAFTDFQHDACHWDTTPSTTDYLSSPAAGLAPASSLPGWHLQMVSPELMHAGPLGHNLVVNGSVIKELADEGFWATPPPTGAWQEKLQLQLSAATAAFKQWQKDNQRSCNQLRFTVRRLSLSSKQRVPELKAKAYNSLIVTEWLESECRKMSERWPSNSYFRDRATMVWGLAEFFRVLRRSPMWMSEEELEDLQVARDAACFLFRKLAGIALEEGAPLYPCRPKLHMLDEAHRLAQTTGENPTSFWTFQDEDSMRILVDIAKSCHGSTVESSTLHKWLMQFFAEPCHAD